MEQTLYDVLGIPRDADPDRVRTAWRDTADTVEPGEGSAERFRRVNEAAEVLLDPERRAAYDATLEEQAAPVADEEPAGVVPGPPMPGASSAAAPTTGTSETVTQDAPGEGTATSPASAVPAGGAATQDGLPRRTVALLVALAVLAAAAVGLGAYFGSQGWQAHQEDQRAERYQEALDRAPAAAENAAAAVLSYDHRSLEADRDAAARFLTDGYREDYVDTFDRLVVESATQTKATVEAEVLASAPMTSSPDRPERVPVLVFVNQTTTSSASTEPRVALNRVQLDMVEVDGTWLVDGITSY